MENFEKFKEEVNKLNQLVNEEEIGISCWWGLLDERMRNVCTMYFGQVPSCIKTSQRT